MAWTSRFQTFRPGYRGRVCYRCGRMRVLADGPWQGICDFCWRRYSVQQQWVSPDERERLLKEWWATQRGRRA